MINELRTYLLADSAVQSLVNSRMYPVILPQGVNYPAISYNQVSNVRERDLCGPAGYAHPRITINAWAESYADVRSLATAVRQRLDGFRGQFSTPDGVRVGSVRLDNEIDDYEQDVSVYRVLMDFIVSHEED